jgi:hypothetical protein
MDWNTLTYTRAWGHQGQPFIRDQRSRPSRVVWSHHALWRADDRARMRPEEARRWFARTAYLGRWARCEVWGDQHYVVTGIRDKGGHGTLTLTTFMPRAYWEYDVSQYDRMMDKLAIRGEAHGKKDHLRSTQR